MNLQSLSNTIKLEGGCSYSLTYGNLAGRKGFAVSPYKEREQMISVNEFNDRELKNYVNENSDLLSKEGHFLGAWVDNNTVYLDVSIMLSKASAIKLAKASSQKAIFDLFNLKTIEV